MLGWLLQEPKTPAPHEIQRGPATVEVDSREGTVEVVDITEDADPPEPEINRAGLITSCTTGAGVSEPPSPSLSDPPERHSLEYQEAAASPALRRSTRKRKTTSDQGQSDVLDPNKKKVLGAKNNQLKDRRKRPLRLALKRRGLSL